MSVLTHPAFDGIRPWLEIAPAKLDALLPEQLNALAAATSRPSSSAGARIRFVGATRPLDALDYESRIYRTGEVATRPGARHDILNALCWLAFPAVKRALNARHVNALRAGSGRRGSVRDAATLFDESGAIALCGSVEIGQLLATRQWKAVFWERRDEAARALHILVCGHAVLEKLLDPYPGITARLLIVPYERPFDDDAQSLRAEADRRAAERLANIDGPPDLPPLPLAGVPQWHPGNDAAAFYDDESLFRPMRTDRMGR